MNRIESIWTEFRESSDSHEYIYSYVIRINSNQLIVLFFFHMINTINYIFILSEWIIEPDLIFQLRLKVHHHHDENFSSQFQYLSSQFDSIITNQKVTQKIVLISKVKYYHSELIMMLMNWNMNIYRNSFQNFLIVSVSDSEKIFLPLKVNKGKSFHHDKEIQFHDKKKDENYISLIL